MSGRSLDKAWVKAIGYAAACIYGSAFFLYLRLSVVGGFQIPGVFLAVLLAALVVSAIGVAWMLEPERRLLVILSFVAVLYMTGLLVFRIFNEFIPVSLVVGILGVAIFFGSSPIRALFEPGHAEFSKSVLVVDDDDGFLKSVRRILINNGYGVLSATHGEKGLKIAQMQKPDLIILDVILPGLKGREVCLKLKGDDRTRKIPVMFVTAKDSLDDIKAEMAVGGLSHVTKPLNPKVFISEVKRLIG